MEQKTFMEMFMDRSRKWKKQELLDVVYWLRQYVAAIIGVVFGIPPFLGLFALAGFAALNAGILFIYYTKYLGVDDEEFGRWDLIKEGFFPSSALFLIFWIISYNSLHSFKAHEFQEW